MVTMSPGCCPQVPNSKYMLRSIQQKNKTTTDLPGKDSSFHLCLFLPQCPLTPSSLPIKQKRKHQGLMKIHNSLKKKELFVLKIHYLLFKNKNNRVRKTWGSWKVCAWDRQFFERFDGCWGIKLGFFEAEDCCQAVGSVSQISDRFFIGFFCFFFLIDKQHFQC